VNTVRQSEPPQPRAGKGPKVTGVTRQVVVALDRAIFGFSRHWLLAFNLLITLYVGVPFLAPVFMRIGWEVPARVVYAIYGPLCNQLAHHSWFLFGQQSYYQTAAFQAYTGIDPNTEAGLLAARAFVGNAQMGYKVAICERDVAIYGAILLFGVIYGIPPLRRRLRPMPAWAWFLVGIVPIGIDGFWQLFTTFPYSSIIHFLSFLPYHESSPLARTLTGGLFGLANFWLAYPYFEESMHDARDELKVKLARVDAQAPRYKTAA
jgi:uncharacterized membrane protein